MGSFSGNFYSEELKTTTRINLILPDASNDVTPLLGGTPKLLFLLHGLGGNCDEWLRFSKIEYYAKKFNLIVVMPEAQRSFYCDYPAAPRYFHYVADELPQLCEQWFALRRPREDCMIAGESMGGYGALKTALHFPERFAAAGIMSAVTDIVDKFSNDTFDKNMWQNIFGSPEETIANGNDIFTLIEKVALQSQKPDIIHFCGNEDFLLKDNHKLRDALERLKWQNYLYQETPGSHSWDFWDRHIQDILKYFFKGDK